jgi:hypothetical protein
MKTRSLKDQTAFRLLGSDVLYEPGFHRLSIAEREAIQAINPGVSWHALHSSGIQALFETDSMNLRFTVTLLQASFMTNMSPTGHSGIDLYVLDEHDEYRLLDVANVPSGLTTYAVDFGHFSDGQMRKYLLNLPVYNAVLEVSLELDDDATIRPDEPNHQGRIAVYGTSIVQGGSVSRPGMLFTNILFRWRRQEILNFGFSGSALCEPSVARMIGSRPNLTGLVIDSEANAGTDLRLRERLNGFLAAFRETYPNVPILLVSRVGFAMDLYDEHRHQLMHDYRTWLQNLSRSERRKGHRVAFLDGSKIFGTNPAEMTVDGIHPSDLGSMALAQSYRRALNILI